MSRLRQLRETKGVSQVELGRRLGMTDSAVSRIETGSRRLSTEMAARWANALGVSVGELMGIGEQENDRRVGHRTIRVVGHAGDASFRRPTAEPDEAFIPIIPWGRYRHLDHSAYKVDDDSARAVAPKGSYVITVPFAAVRSVPLDDDIVIITSKEGNLERHLLRRVSNRVVEVDGQAVSLPHPSFRLTGIAVCVYTAVAI